MICNSNDRDGQCDANDGEPCDACEAERDAERKYWLGRWKVASPAERDPEKYRADLIDAGRGHLVRE